MNYLFLSLFLFLAVPEDTNLELLKVYCSSADIEAGFIDYHTKNLCEFLNKVGVKEKTLIVVENKELSNIVFINGAVSVAKSQGETTHAVYGMNWTPANISASFTAILIIGDYIKEFQSISIGDLVEKVIFWLEKNHKVILDKTYVAVEAQ